MNEQEIIALAVENLYKNTNIKGKWEAFDKNDINGQLKFNIGNKHLSYNIKIRDEWRSHQLPQIKTFNEQHPPIMVVATRLFPTFKEELRLHNIAYLEANGNIYLKNKETTIWIDTNKPIETAKKTVSRAFTKTGLKVVFQFLIDESWINRPYRQIAGQTGTGIGNITNIITGLKQQGFMLSIAKNKYKLNNKQALMNQWCAAYDVKLKPTLKVATFRFLKEEDFMNWKNLPIQIGKTCWGGEPAADLLTNFLKPAELTLYTVETRNELIKNYRLIPDENGQVKVYQKFWNDEEVQAIQQDGLIAPPLLVYADLINTNDRRCTETAQKIYDAFIQDKF